MNYNNSTKQDLWNERKRLLQLIEYKNNELTDKERLVESKQGTIDVQQLLIEELEKKLANYRTTASEFSLLSKEEQALIVFMRLNTPKLMAQSLEHAVEWAALYTTFPLDDPQKDALILLKELKDNLRGGSIFSIN